MVAEMEYRSPDFNNAVIFKFAPDLNRFAIKPGFASFLWNQVITIALSDNACGNFRRKPTADLEIALRRFSESKAGAC
nr:hypothetical protein [Methylomarinum sp. Ch1-1]MDP4521795.1 hypothetical protein [Methylomarinum sp. Ch1-1]